MLNRALKVFKDVVIRTSINTGATANLHLLSDLLLERNPTVILNVGSGSRFPGYEAIDSSLTGKIISVDIDAGSAVDVIADAHFLPFKSHCADAIICQAVLEHTRDTVQAVNEFNRTLKQEGLVYAEIPFLQGYHAHPTDFRRYTIEGLRHLFSGFEEVTSGVCVGPSSALNWILQQYLIGLLTGFRVVSPLTTKILFLIVSLLTFPIKYLDLIVANAPTAHIIAAGLYFLGVKKETTQ